MSSSYESKPLREENRSHYRNDARGESSSRGGGRSSKQDHSHRNDDRHYYNDDEKLEGYRSRSRSRGRDRDNYHSRGRSRSRSRSRSRDRRDYSRERDYDADRRYDRYDDGRRGGPPDHHHNHRHHNHHHHHHDGNRRDHRGDGRDRRDSGRYGSDRDGSENRSPSNNLRNSSSSGRTVVFPYYKVVQTPSDEKLGGIHDDPRGEDPTKRITKKASSRGAGRNTESFDPASTLVRPDLRVQIGSSRKETYNKPLKHDDVVIVPELFGDEDDWDIYYKLVEEMRALQAKEEEEEEQAEKNNNAKKEETDAKTDEKKNNNHGRNNGNRKGGRGGGNSSSSSKWISWHEGAHLISKNPKGCPTYEKIVARLCEYFNIDPKGDVGTRFNWYRDSSDWKPFHHDSAAFNPKRAKNQNITVGASFGAMRELAFIRASNTEDVAVKRSDSKCRIYFPQSNNGVFSFGRDANIHWKHGINALSPDEQDGKGRISIILWGLAKSAIDEDGSPPLLGADGKGPHAMARNNNNNNGRGGGGGGGRNRRNGRR